MAYSPIDTRIRAIIMHENKILLMRLTGSEYFCLPGGGWEAPESSHECLQREILEELGVAGRIGRIAAVNEFQYKGLPCNEMWYFVTNVEDFFDIESIGGSHAHEFEEVGWFDLETDLVDYRPLHLREAFSYWKHHGHQFYQP